MAKAKVAKMVEPRGIADGTVLWSGNELLQTNTPTSIVEEHKVGFTELYYPDVDIPTLGIAIDSLAGANQVETEHQLIVYTEDTSGKQSTLKDEFVGIDKGDYTSATTSQSCLYGVSVGADQYYSHAEHIYLYKPDGTREDGSSTGYDSRAITACVFKNNTLTVIDKGDGKAVARLEGDIVLPTELNPGTDIPIDVIVLWSNGLGVDNGAIFPIESTERYLVDIPVEELGESGTLFVQFVFPETRSGVHRLTYPMAPEEDLTEGIKHNVTSMTLNATTGEITIGGMMSPMTEYIQVGFGFDDAPIFVNSSEPSPSPIEPNPWSAISQPGAGFGDLLITTIAMTSVPGQPEGNVIETNYIDERPPSYNLDHSVSSVTVNQTTGELTIRGDATPDVDYVNIAFSQEQMPQMARVNPEGVWIGYSPIGFGFDDAVIYTEAKRDDEQGTGNTIRTDYTFVPEPPMDLSHTVTGVECMEPTAELTVSGTAGLDVDYVQVTFSSTGTPEVIECVVGGSGQWSGASSAGIGHEPTVSIASVPHKRDPASSGDTITTEYTYAPPPVLDLTHIVSNVVCVEPSAQLTVSGIAGDDVDYVYLTFTSQNPTISIEADVTETGDWTVTTTEAIGHLSTVTITSRAWQLHPSQGGDIITTTYTYTPPEEPPIDPVDPVDPGEPKPERIPLVPPVVIVPTPTGPAEALTPEAPPIIETQLPSEEPPKFETTEDIREAVVDYVDTGKIGSYLDKDKFLLSTTELMTKIITTLNTTSGEEFQEALTEILDRVEYDYWGNGYKCVFTHQAVKRFEADMEVYLTTVDSEYVKEDFYGLFLFFLTVAMNRKNPRELLESIDTGKCFTPLTVVAVTQIKTILNF